MNVGLELDRLDLRILQTLQQNGRMTNKELADKVNLSTSACHQRLQRLIDDGWIKNFLGIIDVERLCAPVQCIATILLKDHAPEAFRTLEKSVESMPEVLEAYTVSGGCDFIVRFACSQMSRYMMLTNALIHECPQISNISTHVILKQSKTFSGYPIQEIISQRQFG